MALQAISKQLNCYFDGLYHSDITLLEQVFHEQARYTCTTGGELIHLSMLEYFDVVKDRQSPASLQQARNDHIVSVDIIGDHTALAKVQCVIEPKYFTDFLSLVFVDGRWQIISKVFHYQSTPFN